MELPTDQAVALYKTSDSLSEIRDKATRHGALERIYQGPFEDPVKESNKYLFARLLMDNVRNSIAPRNRKRIVTRELVNFVEMKKRQGSDQIVILSIGAGSARAILDGTVVLEGRGARVRLILVDRDFKALLYAEGLAKEKGIKSYLETINANFIQFIQNNKMREQIDFIEIVGLFDYLEDKYIQFLLSNIRDYMRKGGTILFSNIVANDEEKFLHTVVGWPQMIYRTEGRLFRLAHEVGYKEIDLIQESTGIYNLIKASK